MNTTIIIALGCFISGFFMALILGDILKRKKQEVKSYNISNEQLNELISKYYKDYNNIEFCEFISDWLKGEIPAQEMKNNSGAIAVEPCKGSECPCFVTREDSCNSMGKDGMCHHLINLNMICGIHECAAKVIDRPELLTEEEIMLINEAIQAEGEFRFNNEEWKE